VIVDAHCHAGLDPDYPFPFHSRDPLAAHLRRSREAGIDRTVVFPLFNRDFRVANARVGRLVAGSGGRLIGFSGVHPERDAPRFDQLLDEAVDVHGLRGVKVHGHEGAPSEALVLETARRGLPMIVDVVGRPGPVAALAVRHPSQVFVIPHAGSFADDWKSQLAVIEIVRALPNVYADTSGIRYWDVLQRGLNRFGPGKLIFGSDGPFLHPAVELEKVRRLGLAPRELDSVLGGTILGLIGRRRAPSSAEVVTLRG
jgi:uncharacterized protein